MNEGRSVVPRSRCRQFAIASLISATVIVAPSALLLQAPQKSEFQTEPRGRGSVARSPSPVPSGYPSPELTPPDSDAEEIAATVFLLKQEDNPYERSSYQPSTRSTRSDASTTGRLRATLEELLSGTRPQEDAEGLSSIFDPATSGQLLEVGVEDGLATIDFRDLGPIIPQASTSEGGSVFLSQLNLTVFALPDIEEVEYRIEGDCDDFWEWLQSTCHTVHREDWQ